LTVYLVHDYWDEAGGEAPAPGFCIGEVESLSETISGLGYGLMRVNGVAAFLDEAPRISKQDVVFNIVSGKGSRNRESFVPAICECRGLKCIGPDSFGAAFTMHKYHAKLFACQLGVNAPRGFYFDPLIHGESYFSNALKQIRPPFIIKPNHENMSRGVEKLDSREGLLERVLYNSALFGQAYVVEEYIAGEELSATIAGTGALASIFSVIQYKRDDLEEIEVFDIGRKEDNDIVYMDPDIPGALLEYIRSKSLLLYRALGLNGFARADWRADGQSAYFLEMTPIPCLREGTEFHFSAKQAGTTFEAFIKTVIESAAAHELEKFISF